MLIWVSLKYWDNDHLYPVKCKSESSVRLCVALKKKWTLEMKSVPGSTDHLAAVSIPSPLTDRRQPHHRERHKNDRRWQILIKIWDHVCSETCSEGLFFSTQTDMNQCWDVNAVWAPGFSYIDSEGVFKHTCVSDWGFRWCVEDWSSTLPPCGSNNKMCVMHIRHVEEWGVSVMSSNRTQMQTHGNQNCPTEGGL